MIAATTNALNGALLVQRPDYYSGRQWTIIGIILLAIFGGIGGGTIRDIIAGKLPHPRGRIRGICSYASWLELWVCSLAYGRAKIRETYLQFMTAFSLALVCDRRGTTRRSSGSARIACIFIGVVGPTAGRFLIDVTAGTSSETVYPQENGLSAQQY